MQNFYTQSRNIYPQSIVDAKRMINNNIPKFGHNNNNNKDKDKGTQQQNEDNHQTEEEELLFLQQQDDNWQYYGWCKKE